MGKVLTDPDSTENLLHGERQDVKTIRNITQELPAESKASKRGRLTTVILSGIERQRNLSVMSVEWSFTTIRVVVHDNKSGTAELYALSLLQRQSVFFL